MYVYLHTTFAGHLPHLECEAEGAPQHRAAQAPPQAVRLALLRGGGGVRRRPKQAALRARRARPAHRLWQVRKPPGRRASRSWADPQQQHDKQWKGQSMPENLLAFYNEKA